MITEKNAKKREETAASAALSAVKPEMEKIDFGLERIKSDVDKLHKKTDAGITAINKRQQIMENYINDQEKAELYHLHTPVDIADLEDAEKRILLAVLYQLATDEEELTEAQQSYVQTVQQYLKIVNPQTRIELEAVENIEDVTAQKAVLQASMEFFYLGTHPKSYTEEQMDFLDCFNVNRKGRKEIAVHIESIISAVGYKGLAEKYGFVPEEVSAVKPKYYDNGPVPEAVADLVWKEDRDAWELKDYFLSCSRKDGKTVYYKINKQTGKKEEIDFGQAPNLSAGNHCSSSCKTPHCIIQNKVCYYSDNQIYIVDMENNTVRKFGPKFTNGSDAHLCGTESTLFVDWHGNDIYSISFITEEAYLLNILPEKHTPGIIFTAGEYLYLLSSCDELEKGIYLTCYAPAKDKIEFTKSINFFTQDFMNLHDCYVERAEEVCGTVFLDIKHECSALSLKRSCQHIIYAITFAEGKVTIERCPLQETRETDKIQLFDKVAAYLVVDAKEKYGSLCLLDYRTKEHQEIHRACRDFHIFGDYIYIKDFRNQYFKTNLTMETLQWKPIESGPFKMTVEDVYTVTGRGTAATGCIEQGEVSLNDRLTLTRSDGTSKVVEVSSIDAFRKLLEVAKTGDHVALILKGVAKTEISKGDILSK